MQANFFAQSEKLHTQHKKASCTYSKAKPFYESDKTREPPFSNFCGVNIYIAVRKISRIEKQVGTLHESTSKINHGNF